MSWRRSAIHVLLVMSVVANMFLSKRVLTANATLEALTARPALQVGDSVPHLALRDNLGQKVLITYGGPVPTVLYVMSTTCAWCMRNVKSITTLAQATSSSARIVGVALTPFSKDQERKKATRASSGLPFPLYHGLSDDQARQLRVRSTPTTIVISPDGHVRAIWEGAYVGEIKNQIEGYFSVKLPELTAVATVSNAQTVIGR